jgi:hypothetical protein
MIFWKSIKFLSNIKWPFPTLSSVTQIGWYSTFLRFQSFEMKKKKMNKKEWQSVQRNYGTFQSHGSSTAASSYKVFLVYTTQCDSGSL